MKNGETEIQVAMTGAMARESVTLCARLIGKIGEIGFLHKFPRVPDGEFPAPDVLMTCY